MEYTDLHGNIRYLLFFPHGIRIKVGPGRHSSITLLSLKDKKRVVKLSNLTAF